jgi:hypothetical protein
MPVCLNCRLLIGVGMKVGKPNFILDFLNWQGSSGYFPGRLPCIMVKIALMPAIPHA